MKYIPLYGCRHNVVYKLHAHNIKYGVFDEKQKGFKGIRTKFGNRFIDVEYHYDTGAPFGTARPIEQIGECVVDDDAVVFRFLDGLPDF